ncbi:amidase domain-containing protein [Embleya sp. NPDC005575]|uniref:amidase domain-containing protein n=1 Tax=Embleya sp. NPDC005575 TaxID=3156892 RepID=UPI0033B5837A
MIVEGLVTSIDQAQRTLAGAEAMASAAGLRISATGAVEDPNPTPAHATPEDVRQQEFDLPARAAKMEEIAALVAQALRAATQADELAAPELDKLAAQTGVADPTQALTGLQGEASSIELAMLGGDIPVNMEPAFVRSWWAGLTPEQQHTLMLSDPVTLSKLAGLPKSVADEMRGPDGKFDRVAAVEWALANWDNTEGDIFANNCTNFVSEALEKGGLKYKIGPFGIQGGGDDVWGRGGNLHTGWGWLDDKVNNNITHSATWMNAGKLQNFLLENGSEDIPRSEVRPGDIIFLDQSGPSPDHKPGEPHHAAIVTAVTPDGDIRYTQHTDPRQNVSLDGRMPGEIKAEGTQTVRVVRVKPNWY